MNQVIFPLTLAFMMMLAIHEEFHPNVQVSIDETIKGQPSVSFPAPSDGAESVLSPSGRYRARPFQLDDPKLGPTSHVLLEDTRQMRSISINPSSEGAVSASIQIQFVVDDNLIISWGCGTYCQSATLFSPDGKLLTQLAIHSVSPNFELAVTFASTAGDRNVRLVDLRTGRNLLSKPVPEKWSACSAIWTSAHVKLQPCDEDVQPSFLSLSIPELSF